METTRTFRIAVQPCFTLGGRLGENQLVIDIVGTMLPEFPKLKERLLRLAWFDHRRRVEADGLIGAIRATPYFEGRRFAAGDVEGHVEESSPEVTAIPYEIARSAIIERGLDALRATPLIIRMLEGPA
jgi:hypothetical protein